ncbi:uncharacterized protein LOC131330815 [Rhododendron vialii]|uniref:uncharacterized protein LOC131330815 n=1 Tax=Rhododendron vialii TaxID=182163 RepID=UPI00265FB2B3|nr:uncharacterized protein LOC131330815 [Rhododendron vialii]XP_058220534.1 uncharacterized protein LOC131330815 [Rhododendron vialii]
MGEEEERSNLEIGSDQDQEEEKGEHQVLKFLDSVDSYLTLFESLSTTLRQGYLELASARQSMGASRINSALFDLKYHCAATSLQVMQEDVKEPDFNLCKWVSPDNNKSCSEEAKFDQDELSERKSSNSQLRYRGTSEIQEKILESNGSTAAVEDQIQQERSKSLSMFGKLVSPKLRDAQLSFETALDILIEIANMRSSLLSAYDQVRKDMESTQG